VPWLSCSFCHRHRRLLSPPVAVVSFANQLLLLFCRRHAVFVTAGCCRCFCRRRLIIAAFLPEVADAASITTGCCCRCYSCLHRSLCCCLHTAVVASITTGWLLHFDFLNLVVAVFITTHFVLSLSPSPPVDWKMYNTLFFAVAVTVLFVNRFWFMIPLPRFHCAQLHCHRFHCVQFRCCQCNSVCNFRCNCFHCAQSHCLHFHCAQFHCAASMCTILLLPLPHAQFRCCCFHCAISLPPLRRAQFCCRCFHCVQIHCQRFHCALFNCHHLYGVVVTAYSVRNSMVTISTGTIPLPPLPLCAILLLLLPLCAIPLPALWLCALPLPLLSLCAYILCNSAAAASTVRSRDTVDVWHPRCLARCCYHCRYRCRRLIVNLSLVVVIAVADLVVIVVNIILFA